MAGDIFFLEWLYKSVLRQRQEDWMLASLDYVGKQPVSNSKIKPSQTNLKKTQKHMGENS